MMKSPSAFLSFGALVLVFAVTGCKRLQKAPPPPPPPGAAAACGGVHRWDVKTASDASVKNQVDPSKPVDTTIPDLLARDKVKPWKVNLNRQVNFDATPPSKAVEATVWRLKCVNVVEFVLEGDDDIHLEVEDPTTKDRMTVEFPDTSCRGAFDSPFKTDMAGARDALTKAFGAAPKRPKHISGQAKLNGIGFFDREHRLGRESTELHPVLKFEVVSCSDKAAPPN